MGVATEKPPEKIPCAACMRHKTPRSNYSHLNKAQKEANKKLLDAEKRRVEQQNEERLFWLKLSQKSTFVGLSLFLLRARKVARKEPPFSP